MLTLDVSTLRLRRLAAALLLWTSASACALDVNRASQAELESIAGIGPGLSTRILEERHKAPYRNWSDLLARVQGIGTRSAARLSRAGLTVDGVAFPDQTGASAPSAPTSSPGR